MRRGLQEDDDERRTRLTWTFREAREQMMQRVTVRTSDACPLGLHTKWQQIQCLPIYVCLVLSDWCSGSAAVQLIPSIGPIDSCSCISVSSANKSVPTNQHVIMKFGLMIESTGSDGHLLLKDWKARTGDSDDRKMWARNGYISEERVHLLVVHKWIRLSAKIRLLQGKWYDDDEFITQTYTHMHRNTVVWCVFVCEREFLLLNF